MDSKKAIWFFMAVGSVAGSFLPELWGSTVFSMSSVVLTAVGGFVGIWFGYAISTKF